MSNSFHLTRKVFGMVNNMYCRLALGDSRLSAVYCSGYK